MTDDLHQAFINTVTKEYDHCALCGECRRVCPVYGVSGLEKNVARGRMTLARALVDGDLVLTDTIRASFENCLLCMACVDICASHVDIIDVVLKARATMVSRKGLARVKSLAFKALAGDRKYQDMGIAAARTAQSVLMNKLPEKSGLRFKLALPQFFDLQKRLLPALAAKPFIRGKDREYKVNRPANAVLLFVGCASNYIYTDIAKKAVRVLNRLGTGVRVLSDQGCCGAPVLAHADIKTLKHLAIANIRCLSATPDQPIITICSSGGLMLKKEYPKLLAGTHDEDAALSVAGRVMDISEFLVDRIGMDAVASSIKKKISSIVSYHDPCHLGRGQSVTIQPRSLLKTVCSQYEEMPDAGTCCGLGGTYGFSHGATSEQILDNKIQAVAGMDPIPLNLATGCPACIMQLTHGFHKHGMTVRVAHTLEYVWQALV